MDKNIFCGIDSIAFWIVPSPAIYGGGIEEVYSNFKEHFKASKNKFIRDLYIHQIEPKATEDGKRILLGYIKSHFDTTVNIEIYKVDNADSYDYKNNNPMGGYEISFGELLQYKPKTNREKIKTQLLYSLADIFGYGHLRLSRLDFAIDFIDNNIKVENNNTNQKYIKKYRNSTYYNFNYPSTIIVYDKQLTDKTNLSVTRVELRLYRDTLIKYKLDKLHYPKVDLISASKVIKQILEEHINIYNLTENKEFFTPPKWLANALLNTIYGLYGEQSKHKSYLYGTSQSNMNRSNKSFEKINKALKKLDITTYVNIEVQLEHKNISINKIAKTAKVSWATAKKNIDFIKKNGNNIKRK